MNADPQKLQATSKFLHAKARAIVAEARENAELLDEPVREAVRLLYDLGKRLSDERARAIAANNRPEPTVGKPTNVGDPNGKGQAGAGKKR